MQFCGSSLNDSQGSLASPPADLILSASFPWPRIYGNLWGVATLQKVIKAYEAIAAAEARYREVLREARAAGVEQVDIAAALGVTREKLRIDEMTDEEREALRERDRLRKADLRQRARVAPSGQ